MRVATAYVEAGFAVSMPIGGGAPYDLIVDTGERLLKAQVKTGRLRNGCVIFPMQRFSGHSGKPQSYVQGEIDFFAILFRLSFYGQIQIYGVIYSSEII